MFYRLHIKKINLPKKLDIFGVTLNGEAAAEQTFNFTCTRQEKKSKGDLLVVFKLDSYDIEQLESQQVEMIAVQTKKGVLRIYDKFYWPDSRLHTIDITHSALKFGGGLLDYLEKARSKERRSRRRKRVFWFILILLAIILIANAK